MKERERQGYDALRHPQDSFLRYLASGHSCRATALSPTNSEEYRKEVERQWSNGDNIITGSEEIYMVTNDGIQGDALLKIVLDVFPGKCC